jgi:hypothetical protein
VDPKEDKALKLHIENNLPNTIKFCCGDKEYELESDRKIIIEIKDGDCLYLDTVK